MKTKPRSFIGTVYAMPGFTLNGGRTAVRSCRFRMKRDAENWLDAMMAQPFAHSGKVSPSSLEPELNALTV